MPPTFKYKMYFFLDLLDLVFNKIKTRILQFLTFYYIVLNRNEIPQQSCIYQC